MSSRSSRRCGYPRTGIIIPASGLHPRHGITARPYAPCRIPALPALRSITAQGPGIARQSCGPALPPATGPLPCAPATLPGLARPLSAPAGLPIGLRPCGQPPPASGPTPPQGAVCTGAAMAARAPADIPRKPVFPFRRTGFPVPSQRYSAKSEIYHPS